MGFSCFSGMLDVAVDGAGLACRLLMDVGPRWVGVGCEVAGSAGLLVRCVGLPYEVFSVRRSSFAVM